MPLPLTVSCSSKIQIGFTFLVPAYPGYPGKEAVKWLLLLLPAKKHQRVNPQMGVASAIATDSCCVSPAPLLTTADPRQPAQYIISVKPAWSKATWQLLFTPTLHAYSTCAHWFNNQFTGEPFAPIYCRTVVHPLDTDQKFSRSL